MADYPESHQTALEKLDTVLEKSSISTAVNLQPDFVMSMGNQFEPFRAKKMNFDIDIMLELPKGKPLATH